MVSFAGYDVIENQSGIHTGKTKISKKGNSRIRRILHMPALVAIKKREQVWKIVSKGKHKIRGKNERSCCGSKKLLVIIYHTWKKGLSYDSNFGNVLKKEQLPTSRMALQKPKKEKTKNNKMKLGIKTIKKLAITGMAKQGKRSVNDHSTPPLGKIKILKKRRKILGF